MRNYKRKQPYIKTLSDGSTVVAVDCTSPQDDSVIYAYVTVPEEVSMLNGCRAISVEEMKVINRLLMLRAGYTEEYLDEAEAHRKRIHARQKVTARKTTI